MENIITLEAKLQWNPTLLYGIDFDAKSIEVQNIINELNSFRPNCNLGKLAYEFIISIDTDEEMVFIRTTVDTCVIFRELVGRELNEATDKILSMEDFTLFLFNQTVKDICLILNLAKPAFFHFPETKYYINGKYIKSNHMFNCGFIFDARQIANKYNWPLIEELPIQKCWDWIVDKTNFLTTNCKGPIDRALNAMSYLFFTNGSECMFYTLLGIEALYNDKKNKEDSIMEQIRFKTSAILGKFPKEQELTMKKKIDDVYRTRSLFLHGVTNFPKRWYGYDENFFENQKKFDKKMFEPESLASAILISTIQCFIKTNANTLIEEKQVTLI